MGRLILVKTAAAASDWAAGVVYARVSSHDQRSDLDRQVARLSGWATEHGLEVGQVVCEVGSGLNGKRPRLYRILSDPDARVIVVEHRDRLARFGVEHLEAALVAQGRRIVVADPRRISRAGLDRLRAALGAGMNRLAISQSKLLSLN